MNLKESTVEALIINAKIAFVIAVGYLVMDGGQDLWETEGLGATYTDAACRVDGDLGVQTKRNGCVSMLEIKERMIEDERQAINSSHIMEDPDSEREALQKLNSKMKISFSMNAAEYVAKWFEKKGYMSCGLLNCEPTSKYWIEVYQGLPNQSYGGESSQ